MLKFQLKKQQTETKESKPFERFKLERKETETEVFQKGIKPIINRSLKQQFNDNSNYCLYGLVQLLLDKGIITNDEYLQYCLEGVTIVKTDNKQGKGR